jgi:hypothetical protein
VENCVVPTSIAKLNLLNVTVIAAGYHHSLCITGDGDACVFCICRLFGFIVIKAAFWPPLFARA